MLSLRPGVCLMVIAYVIIFIQDACGKCNSTQYKDPDSGFCFTCAFCTAKYWSKPYYFRPECYDKTAEPVLIRGHKYQRWCNEGVPHGIYKVCSFPPSLSGQVRCPEGPLPGSPCNLTCPDGTQRSFTCQPSAAPAVGELCIEENQEVELIVDDSHLGITIGVPVGVTVLLLLAVLVVIVLCRCRKGDSRKGSKESLRAAEKDDGSDRLSSNSDPGPRDSLLDAGKDENMASADSSEETHSDASVSPGSSINSAPPSYPLTGYMDHGCQSEHPSQPESLPPPYTPSPNAAVAVNMIHLTSPAYTSNNRELTESMTVPKVRFGPGPPVSKPENAMSKHLEACSGPATAFGVEAEPSLDLSPLTLPESALPLAANLDPEVCTHPVTLLFTERALRSVLVDLQLQLEPLDSRERALSAPGLAMQLLNWSQERVDYVRWARRQDLQESPAMVVLQHLSQEGLKLGHVALYFAQPSHRNARIVNLLKKAPTHQNCPLCSQLQ